MEKIVVPKPPWDTKSCAEFLGVSERTVRKMITSGVLESKKEGKLMLFDLRQVQALRRELDRLRKRLATGTSRGQSAFLMMRLKHG